MRKVSDSNGEGTNQTTRRPLVGAPGLVLVVVAKSDFCDIMDCRARLPGQEYRSGLPFPSPGDHPKPRIEPRSLTLQANSYCLSYQGSPRMLERSLKNNPLKIHFQELKAFSEETHEKSEIRA